MPIIGIGGPKGGCGKTTLITNLAALAAQRGLSVGLLDADPKPDAHNWAKTRAAKNPGLPVIHSKQCYGEIDDAIVSMGNKYDYLFIDTGGMDGSELRYTLAYSQIFLAPFNPSKYDLDTAKKVNEFVALGRGFNPGIKAYSVLVNTSNHRHSKSTLSATKTLSRMSRIPLVSACMHSLEVWRLSAELGRGVSELLNAKAKADIEQLAEEIGLWQ